MRQHPGQLKQQVLIGVIGISLLFGAGLASALEVGDKAPDFELPSTSGEKISLSQFHLLSHKFRQSGARIL